MDAYRRAARTARLALIVATLLSWGCAEQATAPTLPEGPQGVPSPSRVETGAASLSTSVTVLERAVPLAEEERASRTIGFLGGVLVLPRAGLIVIVPPGALSTPTTITVVAPAGSLVGYHFHPEGQTFRVPLLLQQSLLRTEAMPGGSATGQNLVAAYFQSELTPVVAGLELLTLDVLGRLGIFRVEHFSGYVIGTN